MLQIERNKSLKAFNTFGIDCVANSFVSVTSIEALKNILEQHASSEIFILGGGSNMLLSQNIEALVVHIGLKGIKLLHQTEDHVFIEVMAGENWHDFVLYCIDNNYGGIENMSLIPGNVGTAPIQNIGAYGVELKDVFEACQALEVESLTEKDFSNEACRFDYRSSIFKEEARGKYIITRVTFKLTKQNHVLSTTYGAIDTELQQRNITDPSIKDISDVVIAIRQSKLPDPAVLGNSGSFFKNPVIDANAFRVFILKFPDAPFYEISATEFKIPAGWLIEQAGFKGKRFGDAGVHEKQALVLVNYGNATGAQIWELAVSIQKKVKEDYGIHIAPEVNII
jgi:UDP-N-acetylmuramate dehydrogenase